MLVVAFVVPLLAAPQPWPTVLKGVLEGFGVTKDLDAMRACLASTKDEVQTVQGAFELFEKEDAKDVLDGLGKLGSALEKLPKSVSICDDASKDVKDEAPKLHQALEALKHPKQYAYHVGKDLVVNHADIFQEISAAIHAYEQKQWEDCGKSTGAALSKLLVGETSAAFVAREVQLLVNVTPAVNKLKEVNRTQLAVVLVGVLEGFGLTKDLDLMKGCLNETETEVHLVHDAVDLLMKKNAKDAMDGLSKLGMALDGLPKAIQNCSVAAKDVQDLAPNLVQALETLKHPKDFAYHVGVDLWVDHADIFQEIGSAIDDYQKQRWESFGNHTGEALSELLVGKKGAPSHENTWMIIDDQIVTPDTIIV
jgi:ABC-type phosphate/phosphonate transport system ATPase subunit